MLNIPDSWFEGTSNKRRIASALDDDTARQPRPGERALLSFILPPFQRPPVWTPEQKVRLIESIWEGMPVGSYVVNRLRDHENPCFDWLLDGQQRWTAIRDYVEDGFDVFGGRHSELSRQQRMDFRNRTITEIETRLDDPADCLRVYERLAFGGTAHLPEHAPGEASGFAP